MQPQYSQSNNTALFLPQFFDPSQAATTIDPDAGFNVRLRMILVTSSFQRRNSATL
jgi:hypothetical protein